MNKIVLSDRLLAVAGFVKSGARLADIGSDHAFLPTYLMNQGQIDFAVAGEVVKGPFEIAQSHVAEAGLSSQITVRLADGLAAVTAEDAVDTIVIAGMGGLLISEILQAGLGKIQKSDIQLILQPNNHEDTLRRWLIEHGFVLSAEKILLDAGKFYEILVAHFAGENSIELDELDYQFGPFLRREKSEVFVHRWQKELRTLQKILQHLPENQIEKAQAVQKKLAQIEEVLK